MKEDNVIAHLPPGKYRHNKSGKFYDVLGVAHDTETGRSLVVYAPLYTHPLGYDLFTRPYEMFIESVELNGTMQPRFEKIND